MDDDGGIHGSRSTLVAIPSIHVRHERLHGVRSDGVQTVMVDARYGTTELRSYARAKAFFAFAGDLEAMRRWGRNIGAARPATRADVDLTIREVLEARRREANPPVVPSELGWSPYVAKAILEPEGLKTNDYHRSYDGSWFSTSPLKDLDAELFSNNLSFTLEGNADAATHLILSLNINNAEMSKAALTTFAQAAQTLFEATLPAQDTKKLLKAARSGRSCSVKTATADIQLARENWRNGKLSGYKFVLTITHYADQSSSTDSAA